MRVFTESINYKMGEVCRDLQKLLIIKAISMEQESRI